MGRLKKTVGTKYKLLDLGPSLALSDELAGDRREGADGAPLGVLALGRGSQVEGWLMDPGSQGGYERGRMSGR